ncbi:MAG: hypothetical protein Q7R56_00675 [Nanoarchaeota archaeon]|nr:hypothetical protein [Nanoarchaeota archaeon]
MKKWLLWLGVVFLLPVVLADHIPGVTGYLVSPVPHPRPDWFLMFGWLLMVLGLSGITYFLVKRSVEP